MLISRGDAMRAAGKMPRRSLVDRMMVEDCAFCLSIKRGDGSYVEDKIYASNEVMIKELTSKKMGILL
jgi:hypothetical protein